MHVACTMHVGCWVHARCEAIALQKGGVSDDNLGAGMALKAPRATAKGCQLGNNVGGNDPPV